MQRIASVVDRLLGITALALVALLILAGPLVLFLVGLLLPLEIPAMLIFVTAGAVWQGISTLFGCRHRR